MEKYKNKFISFDLSRVRCVGRVVEDRGKFIVVSVSSAGYSFKVDLSSVDKIKILSV